MSFGIIPVINEQVCKVPLTHCVIEVLELRLSCNSLVLNNTNYIQTYDTVLGPNISCSYSDLAMTEHDSKTLGFDFPPKVWKRFRDKVCLDKR